ncbi:asparagine--tRNA ligase, mitochondrial [Lycorma delicatula]|uniref:asparagine--tRNA ligase, mitochondrial n=1 Tax=Lycorma delicatula TaxID=130591 RepID=UPI003F51AC1B
MAFVLGKLKFVFRCKKISFKNSLPKRCWASFPNISTINSIYTSEKFGQIRVEGWIIGIRKLKELLFIDVSDGSCPKKLQLTVDKNKVPKDLSYGASVKASGLLQTNKNNQIEVLVDDIKLVGKCHLNDGYPFAQRTPYNPNHDREFIHLRPRTQPFSSLLRIRHKIFLTFNELLDSDGFFNINIPVLTTNDCEGGGEVFMVKPDNNSLIKDMIKENKIEKQNEDEVFFGSKTYLTVSGQLHLEAVSRALKKVYSLGPTFRAENSRSRLHLSEFYMLEAEIAFINNINDINSVIELLLKKSIDKILSNYSEEIQSYYKLTGIKHEEQLNILNRILNENFTTITYNEAFDILDKKRNLFKQYPKKDETFSKEHELYLVEYNNGIPIFIVEWPEKSKPFYMKSVENLSDKVEAVDLLCPNVGELCGGGVREDNYDILKQKLMKENLDSKLDWYLQLRNFGNVRTGGFGMGFERFLQLLLGITNIKDTIPFPRWPHNCKL